jgi:hypothetical protein
MALYGSEFLNQRPSRFLLPDSIHSIEGWVGPRTGLDALEKIKFFELHRDFNPALSTP